MLLKKLLFWLYITFQTIMIRLSIALYITEQEILKPSNLDVGEGNKMVQRHRHHNKLLEKFYAGQRDEQYYNDYYEVLKKADNFKKKSTPYKMEIAAYKYGTSYGMKDKFGRKYEHYGFFDEKHKHSGKTLGEVLELEMKERGTKDDDYELLYVFNNQPIEKGVGDIIDIVIEKEDGEFEVVDNLAKSKQFEFPLKPFRKKINNLNRDVVNKIEQLTEYLHIKYVGTDSVKNGEKELIQLEFFIPNKFRTCDVIKGSDIFNQLIDIDGVYINDDYGSSLWFGVGKLIKRVEYNATHEVWKFDGFIIEKL